MERVFIAAGLLLVAGLIAFAVVRTNRRAEEQASTAPVATAPAAQTPAAAPPAGDHDHDHAAEATIPRMSAQQLKAAVDAGTAVVIDVRDANSFMAGHVPGAFHIPLEYIESQTPYLPRGKTIVAYCT